MEKLRLYLNPRLVAADFTQILRAPRDYQGVSLFKSKNKTWWVIRTNKKPEEQSKVLQETLMLMRNIIPAEFTVNIEREPGQLVSQ
ncbi:hypothetical protein KQX54_009794 [Cotesia glomerata]|uniref:Uncharacterized protein n=1 Tax=Cotesia glomerata TaxID=32391 RepID=A0AAV7J2X2_COTGL|nr:hypothetical protein KQX54_009794 [Cotesia glomerata]